MRKITNASNGQSQTAIYTAKDHPENISKQLKENSEKFNWDGIKFPASFQKTLINLKKQKSINLYQCFLVMRKKSIH